MTDSKKIDDGGYAFPWQIAIPAGSFNAIRNRTVPKGEVDNEIFPGMSLRDWFAGQALAAFGAAFLGGGWHNPNDYQIGFMVKGAYRAADAMIAARKGRCPVTDLTSLIEKLEKAEGTDRFLDARICWTLGFEPWAGTDEIHLTHFGIGSRIDKETPAYTYSIDAAVSLAERMLPNWQINLSIFHDTLAEASFGNREAPHARRQAKTPAIAIVAATLRALQSRGDA